MTCRVADIPGSPIHSTQTQTRHLLNIQIETGILYAIDGIYYIAPGKQEQHKRINGNALTKP